MLSERKPAMPPAERSSPLLQGLKNAMRALHQCCVTFHEWKTEYQLLGCYSIEKLVMFHKYQSTVSQWRVVLVIVSSPMHTLLVLAGLDMIALKDPRLRASQHWGTFLRSALSHTTLTYSLILAVKQAIRLVDHVYSHQTIAMVSVLTGVTAEAL